MTLQEQFREQIIPDDTALAVDICEGIVDDVATDFLEWYLSEEDDKEFQPKSVQELYEQFKIQKGL